MDRVIFYIEDQNARDIDRHTYCNSSKASTPLESESEEIQEVVPSAGTIIIDPRQITSVSTLIQQDDFYLR
jgi:hypothetical protein